MDNDDYENNNLGEYQNMQPWKYKNLKIWLIVSFIVNICLISIFFIWIVFHPQLRQINVLGSILNDFGGTDKSIVLITRPLLHDNQTQPYDLTDKGPELGFYNADDNGIPYGYQPKIISTSIKSYWEKNETGYNDYKNDVLKIFTLKNSQSHECLRCGRNGLEVDMATITNLTSTTTTITNLTTTTFSTNNGIFTNITVDHLHVVGENTLIVDHHSSLNTVNATSEYVIDSNIVRATITNLTSGYSTIDILYVGTLVFTNQSDTGQVNSTVLTCIDLYTYGTLFGNMLLGSTLTVTGQSTLDNTIIGTSGSYTKKLAVNRIESIGDNDDIQIDANGSGKIILDTLTGGGVRMRSVDSTVNWLSNMAYSLTNASRAVVFGVYDRGTELRPTFAGHVLDVDQNPSDWATFWLNWGQTPGTHCIIIGDSTSSVCSPGVLDNAFYVTGNMQTSADIRAINVISSTSLMVGAKTITLNSNNFKLDLLTFPTTSLGSNNNFLQSDGTGNVVWSSDLNVASVTTSGDITIGSSGAYTSSLKSNFIQSIGSNDNIIITPNGVGNVKFTPLPNHGVLFENIDTGTLNTYWISWAAYTLNSDSKLIAGTFASLQAGGNTEMRPMLAAHTSAFDNWKPMWLNMGEKVIMGDANNTQAGTNKLYVVGSMESTSKVTATEFDIGTTPVVRLNSGSVQLGSLTFPTTLSGTSGQFLKSNGDNTISWADGTFTNGVTTTDTLTLDRLVIGDGTKTVKASTIDPSTIATTAVTLTTDRLVVGNGGVTLKTSTVDPSTITTNAVALTSNDIVTGSGGNALKTDSSLSISTKIEATKTIHTTGNIEVATSVLTSAGAGTITIPATTGTMMIDTTWQALINRIHYSPAELAVGCSPGPSCEFDRGTASVNSISSLMVSGSCRIEFNSLISGYIIEIRDMSGTVIGGGSDLTTGPHTTPITQGIFPSNPAVDTELYISFHVVFQSYTSGTLTLKACRLDPQ